VIGIDIGTTSTKSVAYDVKGHAGAAHAVGYPLDEPAPGYAEQDPELILAAVIETVREVAAQCPGRDLTLSFSTAMHSLIGLDPDGTTRGPARRPSGSAPPPAGCPCTGGPARRCTRCRR